MTGARISVVMIGCGNFARRYHVPTLEADPDVAIVGIADPFPSEAVRALASRCGAPLVSVPEALPAPPGPTVCIVTSPHTLHAAHCRHALSCGWHVLCDKPFVMKVAEARELAEEGQRRNLIGAVGFNRRTDRGCLTARDMIRAGEIGHVRFVETVQLGYESSGWFLDPTLGGGGPFTGRGTHMADIVPWLLDRTATRLRARVRGGSATEIDRGGFVEILFGDLEYRMTCIAEGWHMWDEVRIFGETGLIELRRPLEQFIGWELSAQTMRGQRRVSQTADMNIGGATRDMLAAIRSNGRPVCAFAEAIPSVQIIEAAFLSAKTGGDWIELT